MSTEGISSINPPEPPSKLSEMRSTRRTFLQMAGVGVASAAAAASGAGIVNWLDQQAKSQGVTTAEYVANTQEGINLKRRLYGISVAPRRAELDSLILEKKLKPQKYDLSCEIACLSYLLRAIRQKNVGQPYTEDDLIDKLPVSEYPWYGVHPKLRDVPFGEVHRLGNLPPAPYGIYPLPLAVMLNNKILTDVAYKATVANHLVILDIANYENALYSGLKHGSPVICWKVTPPEARPVASFQYENRHVVAPFQHAVLITGIGENRRKLTTVEFLDPVDPERYYYESLDKLYSSSLNVGLEMLCLNITQDIKEG